MRKIYLFLSVIFMIIFATTPISSATGDIEVEVTDVTLKSEYLTVVTKLNFNINTLPELNGYICVFDRAGNLKAVSISDIHIRSQYIKGYFSGSYSINDTIKIFIWDSNLVPYSNNYSVSINKFFPSTSNGTAWS